MQKNHIERLRTLYSVIAGIPSKVIEMDRWRVGPHQENSDKKFIRSAVKTITKNEKSNPYDCGTSACALGWACAYPEFKAQGLKFKNGSPSFREASVDSWGWQDGFEVGSKFFGISHTEASHLFVPVSNNDVDHKKVFLNRLRSLLVKKNIITKERAKELKAQEPLYN